VRNAKNEKEAKALLEKGVTPGKEGCPFCGTVFEQLPKLSALVQELIANYDYDSFLVGAHVDRSLTQAEELLWEAIGAEHGEALKKELVRAIGMQLEQKTGKRVDFKNPDINALADFTTGKVAITSNSLYLYGQYRKLARMPQTTWWCLPCGGHGCAGCGFRGKLFDESVEEYVSAPIVKATGGKGEKFHGSGREDMDARMLGHRPFVLEIESPIRRHVDFAALEKEINAAAQGKVEVTSLRLSSKEEMRFLKAVKNEKTYEAIVECEQAFDPAALLKAERDLNGAEIAQQTPERVAQRRADMTRKRKVLSIKLEAIGPTSIRAAIRAEAGTYIKELVSGDDGRTKPSLADYVGKCKVKELNVLEVHGSKELVTE
jgi:tRNA pseudouridine synthase 10